MKIRMAMVGVTILSCGAGWGQTAAESPTFEVASVKRAAPQTTGTFSSSTKGGPGTGGDPGQLTYTNVAMNRILMNAYGVESYQISGPKWLDEERFNITAKIAPGATKEQVKLMLQNLLTERFKLAAHRETKELPMYALVVGKGGPKLKESAEDARKVPEGASPGAPGAPAPPPLSDGGAPLPRDIKFGADGIPKLPPGLNGKGMMMMVSAGRMTVTANAQPISALISLLGRQVGRPVRVRR